MFKLELGIEKFRSRFSSAVFDDIKRGVEKENLRVQFSGELSRRPHPKVLGHPLTNPFITTDFSESQPELVTPAVVGMKALFGHLHALNYFVNQSLVDEYLWPMSMPPAIADSLNLPIANYGEAFIGQMKRIYRKGLVKRYPPIMQMICGLHYNISFPDAFFQALKTDEALGFKDFRSSVYMKMLRGFRQLAWIMPYLFGASPICFAGSVPNGKPVDFLTPFDSDTVYSPKGASLRTGALGYQSDVQSKINIDFSSAEAYAKSLNHALYTPYPAYEAIGLKVDGQYQQLSTSLLQTEGEYYNFIRPKPKPEKGVGLSKGLMKHGVDYLEVRILDLDPFFADGLSLQTAAFIDVLLLFGYFVESQGLFDQKDSRANVHMVAEYAFDASLSLKTTHGEQKFTEIAKSLLNAMEPVSQLMDDLSSEAVYQSALKEQMQKINGTLLTPAQAIVETIRSEEVSYRDFCFLQAEKQIKACLDVLPDPGILEKIQSAAHDSLQEADGGDNESGSLDDYIRAYFDRGKIE